MEIIIEFIAEVFISLFGSQVNKLGLDRDVPN